MLSIDYLDADVAYLLGLLVARGELLTGDSYRMVIHFPKGALLAQGEKFTFQVEKEIRLGMEKVRERLLELSGGDVQTVDKGDSLDLVIRLTRNTIMWRNIRMLLRNRSHFTVFEIPEVLFDKNVPVDVKREFARGFADVAGNIRPANRDQVGRHRVRLDVLNYPSNWKLPIQLCLFLQEQLNTPVPSIIWGHPNLGREWREHQINLYAEDFSKVGFFFDYKTQALEELAELNTKRFPTTITSGCPGQRPARKRKPKSPEEKNGDRLSPELVGKHFNAYWQICRALGCPRRPQPKAQIPLIPEEP